MKRKLLFFNLIFVALIIFSFQPTYAADNIASGNDCGVDWRITSTGDLIIGTAGETQYLDINSDGINAPWYKNSGAVKSVHFAGKVIGKSVFCLFYECSNLTSVTFKGFDTSQTTDMGFMFCQCYNLQSLDVSGFDTSKVTNMESMFLGCKSLSSLDVSGFDTSNVLNMASMFFGCSSLTSLDMSGFDMGKVNDANEMLAACTALKTIKAPRNLTVTTDLSLTMYDLAGKAYVSLPKNQTNSISLYNEATHLWDSVKIQQAATCTTDGVMLYTCSSCGGTKTETIAKSGHKWDSGTIAKPAKYFSTGVKTYTCNICGSTKSQAIPSLNPAGVTPAKVKLTKATPGKKKLTVKWKRIAKNTKGYQVALKDKKTGKQKYITVKQSKNKTLSKTIKKLKKKKTYAVRVRAYNVIGTETIYGPWSNVKIGKVK